MNELLKKIMSLIEEEKVKTPDRVSCSIGIKFPGIEKYSTIDLHESLSSDVGPNESLEDAHKRVQEFVENKLRERYAAFKAKNGNVNGNGTVNGNSDVIKQEDTKHV